MRTEDRDLEAAKAAVLASEGLTQKQIAERLGSSQTTISRLLEHARHEEWLVNRPRCELPPKRISELKELIYGQGLLQRLQDQQPPSRKHLKVVKVFDIGHRKRRDAGSYREGLSTLGALAASYFAKSVLPKVDSMGIAWGATLSSLLEELEGMKLPKRTPGIQFVPVCGDPPEVHSDALRSSFSLVAQLDKYVNGTRDNSCNFTGVFAAIPREIKSSELAVIRRLFQEIQGYERSFGGKNPQVDRVDSILTSVGSAQAIEDPWGEAMADAVRLPHRSFTAMTFGNIGGVFLKRRDLNNASLESLREIDKRWTGLRETHFLRCARDAADSERAGVVVLASGTKSEILLECVRRGLVSQLLIDHELAGLLSRTLPR